MRSKLYILAISLLPAAVALSQSKEQERAHADHMEHHFDPKESANRPWQNPPLLEDDSPTGRRHDLRRQLGAEAVMPVPNRSERALDCVSGEYERN